MRPGDDFIAATGRDRSTARQPQPAPTRPISVILVEDHLILAESFGTVLSRDPSIEVLGIASTARDAIALAKRGEPDITVMDIQLPDGSGVDAAVAIRSFCKRTAFVFLTAYDDLATLSQAVEAGAAAFLPKSEASETVVEAIKRVAGGEMLIEPGRIQDALAWHRAQREHERERETVLAALTNREMDVLKLLADGKTTQAIATRLHVSSLTVRTHIRSLLSKLDAHSQLQAVAKAQTLGIITATNEPR